VFINQGIGLEPVARGRSPRVRGEAEEPAPRSHIWDEVGTMGFHTVWLRLGGLGPARGLTINTLIVPRIQEGSMYTEYGVRMEHQEACTPYLTSRRWPDPKYPQKRPSPLRKSLLKFLLEVSGHFSSTYGHRLHASPPDGTRGSQQESSLGIHRQGFRPIRADGHICKCSSPAATPLFHGSGRVASRAETRVFTGGRLGGSVASIFT
jgi:hypothetical protein